MTAKNGFKTKTNFLISQGANPNAKDKNGRTPLHRTLNDEVIKMLLAAKADINAIDDKGCTPLHYAIFSYRAVETLLEHKAQITKDTAGFTPIDKTSWASFYGPDSPVVDLLKTEMTRLETLKKQKEMFCRGLINSDSQKSSINTLSESKIFDRQLVCEIFKFM